MALVRSWMSDALRAGIAGLAIPVALLAVLAVLGLGGAFGGLSSLGQLVVGPQVPLGPVPQASPTAGTGAAANALPTIPRLRPAGGGSSPTAGRPVHRFAVTAPRTPSGTSPTRPLHHARPTPGPHGAPMPSTPAPKGSGSPGTGTGCSGNACRKPSPNPVQQLLTAVQQSVPPAAPVPQSPADAINTIQQLGSSIASSGQKLVAP